MSERKKFYEVVNERLHDVVTQLMEEFPELEGATIALTYAQEIGDPPACLVLGDLKDPHLLCRMGLQTAKLQSMVSQGISQHIIRALEAHTRLTQETDDKREDKDPPSLPETPGHDAGVGYIGRPPFPPKSS